MAKQSVAWWRVRRSTASAASMRRYMATQRLEPKIISRPGGAWDLCAPRSPPRALRVNPSLPPPHAVPNSPMLRYLRRNKSLAVGIVLLAQLALFIIIGNLTVDTELCREELRRPLLQATVPFSTTAHRRTFARPPSNSLAIGNIWINPASV